MTLDKRKTVALLLGLCVYACALPATSPDEDPFARLKSLKGRWIARPIDGSKPIEVVYDSASKGSIVTEQFGVELSVFYKDGDQLLMTHFCNAGNQPRLKLRAVTDVSTLTFGFYDITNLRSPDDAHVDEVSYHFRSPDLMDGTWTWKEKGALRSEKYLLTRQAGPATGS
jgi:hypothetical protein